MDHERLIHDLQVKLWVGERDLESLPETASAVARTQIEAEITELRRQLATMEKERGFTT